MDDTIGRRFAVGSGLFTGFAGIVALGLALVAVPVAGAFCSTGCVPYPYLGTAARYPQDFAWHPPAILFVFGYLALMLAIHQQAPAPRRILSQAGVYLAVIATAVLAIDYYVQFAVVPISLQSGETNGLPLLIQYNGHGLFIALEELGYLTMSASLAAASLAISGEGRARAAVRQLFRAPVVVAVLGLIWVTAAFGLDRQDRFEIPILAACWLTLIAGSFLLAAAWRRQRREPANLLD